jgi:2-polyprenyl-3-methyl-5-hydroxy-6-metoxy-1,4-benzoquinol methylase
MGEFQKVDFYNDPENHVLITLPLETSPWRLLYSAVADILGHPDGRRIVELGCGTGRLARLMHDRGWRNYLGIDFAEVLVAHAIAYCPEMAFDVADIFSPYARAKIAAADIVVITEVLEHLEDDLAVFDRVHPGVFMVFSVPDFDCPSHIRHFGGVGEVMERYLRFFRELRVTPLVTGDGTYFVGSGTRK